MFGPSPGGEPPQVNPRKPPAPILCAPIATTRCHERELPKACRTARPVTALTRGAGAPVWPRTESGLCSLSCQVSLPLSVF